MKSPSSMTQPPKERPILFSARMVRALLDGRKTQTRRALKLTGFREISEFGPSDTPGYAWHFRDAQMRWQDFRDEDLKQRLPFAVGDQLWVREAFKLVGGGDPGVLIYRANWREDAKARGFENIPAEEPRPWTSPIHMPRRASRLTLAVTDVRVERLCSISEADARAEGAEPFGDVPAPYWCGFQALWISINGVASWEANPWVVAVTFKADRRNIVAARA